MNKTGRIVTETNVRFLTDAELQEWNDAVNVPLEGQSWRNPFFPLALLHCSHYRLAVGETHSFEAVLIDLE
jgi:hypothetical protein